MAGRNSEKKRTQERKRKQRIEREKLFAARAKKYRGHKLTREQLEFLVRLHT